MAPPPLVDLFDWRVPDDWLLATICVSREYARDWFDDGLRAPPRTGWPSPAATANGVTSRATAIAATTIQGPFPRNGRRLRMLLSIRWTSCWWNGRRRGHRVPGERVPPATALSNLNAR